MFTSQGQAKRFFVEKILAQAKAEGQPLSEAEQWMLSFSESDPEFTVEPTMVERLATEIADDESETKIAGLIERECAGAVETNRAALDSYRQAYATLSQGDHYLLIMLKRGLSRWQAPWLAASSNSWLRSLSQRCARASSTV